MTAKAKPRRRGMRLPRTVAGRRRLTAAAVLVTAAALGFGTTCILYPRPLFRADRPVRGVLGLPVGEAEEVLTGLGFAVKVDGETADPDVPAGHVAWQDPPPDLVVESGTTVYLVRSSGPALVAVPDVASFDLGYATRVLLAAGLTIGTVDSVPSPVDAGVVVSTRPAPGAGRAPGSSIDLVVSRGPAIIRVPNVVGLPLPEARERLQAVGLEVGRIERVRRGPPGTVLEQRPRAGARSADAGRVDLVVAEVD